MLATLKGWFPMFRLRSVAAVGAALLVTAVAPVGVRSASAVPFLQLDIGGGVYDSVSQSIVPTSDPFTLYALLTPAGDSSLLGLTYYISAALAPQTSTSGSLGSFTFDGTTVDVTNDMTYGRPPMEGVIASGDAGDLPPHGVFPTFFEEFAFTFDPNDRATTYNTRDDPGGPTPNSSGGTYFAAFSVDTTALASGYYLVFDLYTKGPGNRPSDIDVGIFAPFSHNAESREVSEPASLLLLGTGLAGLALWRHRQTRKRES